MPSLDLSLDYKKVKDKVTANQSYNDLKTKYDDISKRAGDNLEELKSKVTESIDSVKDSIDNVKEQVERYKKEIKNQFEELLDINKITSGQGSNSAKYIKKMMITALKNIQPKLSEILIQESLTAVGCDQQQVFNSQVIFIKVKSIDIINSLKIDPNTKIGKLIYEKEQITVQTNPFPLNKELYQRIQSGQPYSTDNGQLYKGVSGQDLFDIQYVEIGSDSYFKVTLPNRVNNINRVGEFMVDYYKTMKPIEFQGVINQIMQSLCNSFSISAGLGVAQVEDATKFDIFVSRILGLCFDNRQEIDVSGVAKIAELGDIDENFFELTEIDLRNIDQRVTNFQNGVIEYLECTNAKLPVNANQINDAIINLIEVPDDELVEAAITASNTLANNPTWEFGIRPNIDVAIDLDFIKQFAQGVISGLLTPKILLPVFIMLKALGQSAVDAVEDMVSFLKNFKEYAKNIISKIGALFVQELFQLIKKDILNLIQQIIADIQKEKLNKKIAMILKLVGLLIIVANFIKDFRKCKSLVDELLNLLKIATQGWGGDIPLPILFASRLLDGFSDTRAFINVIEEMQKLGIPTGDLPDGTPNLELLSRFAQIKGMSFEETENGKVQVALGALTITPAGLTVPTSAFGKKI
jgi:ElaB/YqjD/DUF883 family membrane-anchored ribosome-binding protein